MFHKHFLHARKTFSQCCFEKFFLLSRTDGYGLIQGSQQIHKRSLIFSQINFKTFQNNPVNPFYSLTHLIGPHHQSKGTTKVDKILLPTSMSDKSKNPSQSIIPRIHQYPHQAVGSHDSCTLLKNLPSFKMACGISLPTPHPPTNSETQCQHCNTLSALKIKYNTLTTILGENTIS